MFISLPQRISMPAAYAFSGLLFVAQVAEGTTVYLAVMCLAFVMLSVLAFNIAGGLVYPSGAYIAACGVLTATLGMVVKVLLGEPMQRNLLVPEKSMSVYVVGMAAMLVASYVNRLMRPRRALLEGMAVSGNASSIGIACMVVGVVVPRLLPVTVVSTFNQANYFLYLAVLLTVFDTVRRSNGRRSFTVVAFIAWAYTTGTGFLIFSKEGMFSGSAAWIVAAVAAGYRASVRQLIAIGAIAAVALLFLTPFSQVARNYGYNLPPAIAFGIAVDLLRHPLDLRETAIEQNLESDAAGSFHLFDKPEGIFDRLNTLNVDDALIDITDKGVTGSPAALWSYFTNLIPRYVYPDKPTLRWGNVYSHKLNMLPPDDDSTGISFSPFGDGYHTGQWMGVTLYAFGIYLFGFFMMDAVGGNAQRCVWSLLYLLILLHQAAEGLLNGPVFAGGTFTVFVIGLAIICTRVLPAITNLVSSPREQKTRSFDAADTRAQSA